MLPSPTKSVRFQKETPLRGVLKKTDFKPEVVIPVWASPVPFAAYSYIFPLFLDFPAKLLILCPTIGIVKMHFLGTLRPILDAQCDLKPFLGWLVPPFPVHWRGKDLCLRIKMMVRIVPCYLPLSSRGMRTKLPRKCMYMAVDCVVYGVEYVLPDHPKAIFTAVTKQPPIWLCRANTMSF